MTAIRKPLLFLLVLTCAASLAASGRFSLRLFFDTSIALAAIPIIQVLAFIVVYWSGSRPIGFSSAIDQFFDGLWPWFLTLAIAGLFGAIATPAFSAGWFGTVGDICGPVAVIASIVIDWRYFRQALGRGPRRAVIDVTVQRAIGWPVTIAYFFITAWPKAASLVPAVAMNLFWTRS